jgi:transposase-like protein
VSDAHQAPSETRTSVRIVVNREWLKAKLDQGGSYEAIARELGCSASKVAYWADKHGLKSAHVSRRVARGELDEGELRALVEDGASVREIAAAMDRSATTVRYWLDRHGIDSPMARRRGEGAVAIAAGADEAILTCVHHGPARHVRRDRGFRCVLCRSAAVGDRRRRIKAQLLTEAGGHCVICGYDRCVAALHFHHLDPEDKSFALAVTGVTRSLAAARAEASKCIVLCANCHAEVESGLADVPVRSDEPGVPGSAMPDPG